MADVMNDPTVRSANERAKAASNAAVCPPCDWTIAARNARATGLAEARAAAAKRLVDDGAPPSCAPALRAPIRRVHTHTTIAGIRNCRRGLISVNCRASAGPG